jgi:hypothetical protein
VVGPTARTVNRTAEAARVLNSSIRQSAVKLNRRFHSDLPQLLSGLQTLREKSQRHSPVPLPSVRQDLTMLMCIRRLTRLTNAFSKKWENLQAAIALHLAWYNFIRVHQTLKTTPAVKAGLTDHVWTWQEMLTA